MGRKRLLWHLYPYYVITVVVCLAAVARYATGTLRNFLLTQTSADLEGRLRLIERQFQGLVPDDSAAVDSLCKELGRRAGTRITVILPSGQVIGDSDGDPAQMENHADRPEIISAMRGRTGRATRFSTTMGREMVYVAVPLIKNDQTVGVIRAAKPLQSALYALRADYNRIALSALILILVAAALSLVVAVRISRLVARLKEGAQRFARGELQHRIPVPDVEELAELAQSLNQMAAQLNDRMQTIVSQRSELEAVLSSMPEGVIAVDAGEKVLALNHAAAEMFGLDALAALGRDLRELIRVADLQDFVSRTLSSSAETEGEIVLQTDGEKHFQVRGTVLRDANGRKMGALVVLSDVTRLRRLEAVRRDFVANVSHELKTPITSIKGFVETLQSGAMREPDKAEKFLNIIAEQVDRLNTIIEDLLLLSCIEQDAEKSQIALEEASIKEVLVSAFEACRAKAEARGISVELKCDESLRGRINAPLLEQAVVNLIDNAVKYSNPGGRVEVEASKTPVETIITVRDWGCGIGPEHLSRLFERFYRVDKARSRQLGGSGLGLAIVKHIAQAHGGSVTVESRVGLGSTFRVHLPNA